MIRFLDRDRYMSHRMSFADRVGRPAGQRGDKRCVRAEIVEQSDIVESVYPHGADVSFA